MCVVKSHSAMLSSENLRKPNSKTHYMGAEAIVEYLNKLIKDLEQAEAQKKKDIKRRRLKR